VILVERQILGWHFSPTESVWGCDPDICLWLSLLVPKTKTKRLGAQSLRSTNMEHHICPYCIASSCLFVCSEELPNIFPRSPAISSLCGLTLIFLNQQFYYTYLSHFLTTLMASDWVQESSLARVLPCLALVLSILRHWRQWLPDPSLNLGVAVHVWAHTTTHTHTYCICGVQFGHAYFIKKFC
jgi:hypothetical protein